MRARGSNASAMISAPHRNSRALMARSTNSATSALEVAHEQRRIEDRRLHGQGRRLEDRTVPQDILARNDAHHRRRLGGDLRADEWNGQVHGVVRKLTAINLESAKIF